MRTNNALPSGAHFRPRPLGEEGPALLVLIRAVMCSRRRSCRNLPAGRPRPAWRRRTEAGRCRLGRQSPPHEDDDLEFTVRTATAPRARARPAGPGRVPGTELERPGDDGRGPEDAIDARHFEHGVVADRVRQQDLGRRSGRAPGNGPRRGKGPYGRPSRPRRPGVFEAPGLAGFAQPGPVGFASWTRPTTRGWTWCLPLKLMPFQSMNPLPVHGREPQRVVLEHRPGPPSGDAPRARVEPDGDPLVGEKSPRPRRRSRGSPPPAAATGTRTSPTRGSPSGSTRGTGAFRGVALDGLRPRHAPARRSWTGEGFIDWNGINFNGKHEVHPRVLGLVQVANPVGPGWANPADGRFDDPRPPAATAAPMDLCRVPGRTTGALSSRRPRDPCRTQSAIPGS